MCLRSTFVYTAVFSLIFFTTSLAHTFDFYKHMPLIQYDDRDFQRGKFMAEQGNYKIALNYFKRTLSKKPSLIWAKIWVAICYNNTGKNKDYFRIMRELSSINPTNADEYVVRGFSKEQLGYFREAIKDYSYAIKLHAQAEAYRGSAKEEIGDYAGAIQDFKDTIKKKPNEPYAWAGLGHVYLSIFDYHKAIDSYSIAIKMQPHNSFWYNNRGYAKLGSGDFIGAINDCSRAISLKPDFIFAWRNRGDAKSMIGDLQGAINDIDRAIELNPSYAEAYANRAAIRGRHGDYESAIKDCVKSLDIKPDYFFTYKILGLAKESIGDLEGAIANLEKAASLKPTDADIKYRLGCIYIKKGMIGAATEQLKTIRKLDTAKANNLYKKMQGLPKK